MASESDHCWDVLVIVEKRTEKHGDIFLFFVSAKDGNGCYEMKRNPV